MRVIYYNIDISIPQRGIDKALHLMEKLAIEIEGLKCEFNKEGFTKRYYRIEIPEGLDDGDILSLGALIGQTHAFAIHNV